MNVCLILKNFPIRFSRGYNSLQLQPPYASDYQYRIITFEQLKGILVSGKTYRKAITNW